jgi:hypothetical protein
MPQIALRPFMAAVMRAARHSVKSFRPPPSGRNNAGDVLNPPDFSPLN